MTDLLLPSPASINSRECDCKWVTPETHQRFSDLVGHPQGHRANRLQHQINKGSHQHPFNTLGEQSSVQEMESRNLQTP